MWDKDKAIKHLNSHAGAVSKSKCAFFVRQAIAAGGIGVSPTQNAKDYGPNLRASGFEEVSPVPTTYNDGDVAVIQPATGHPSGHMAMYNGKEWVSDFKQKNGLYPGETYRKEKPAYKIYRHASQ